MLTEMEDDDLDNLSTFSLESRDLPQTFQQRFGMKPGSMVIPRKQPGALTAKGDLSSFLLGDDTIAMRGQSAYKGIPPARSKAAEAAAAAAGGGWNPGAMAGLPPPAPRDDKRGRGKGLDFSLEDDDGVDYDFEDEDGLFSIEDITRGNRSLNASLDLSTAAAAAGGGGGGSGARREFRRSSGGSGGLTADNLRILGGKLSSSAFVVLDGN